MFCFRHFYALTTLLLLSASVGAEIPVVGSCKQFDVSNTSTEVADGIQFSHSGFWHQVADTEEPYTHAIAKTLDGQEFPAVFRECRQGIVSKECYYGWKDDIPRKRGLKINLTLYRERKTCVETYSQDDVDSYLVQQKREADKKAKLAELRKQIEQKIDAFNDECIFTVMPERPNPLISESIRQLCRSLAQRYAEQGLLSVRLFVIRGDQFSARLVCNIKDSWTRSDPTFLKSVASRCDRFSQSGNQSFIRQYPMSDIENLEKVLESPVLKVEND